MFDRFYGFWSRSKVKFYFHLIYGILAIHLSVYAVALARYEFAVFSLDNKITNIATISEGQSKERTLGRIAFLSKEETPVEPIIYNIFSSLKSLFSYFDDKTFENCQRLSEILSDNRDNISNVNLEKFKFCGSRFINTGFFFDNYKEEGVDFTNSNFNRVNLRRAILKDNLFQYSKFYSVDFTLADMRNADFAFGVFDNCNLSMAFLQNSNLCNVKFINMDENKIPHFTDANLVSADLSSISLNDLSSVKFDKAYYNSQFFDCEIDMDSHKRCIFIVNKFPSCIHHNPQFPPTKFPEGFDPEAHGMIDISKW